LAGVVQLCSTPKIFQLRGLSSRMHKRQQSQGRSASRAQAKDVVELLEKLDKADRLPCFMVHSDDLPRVLPLLGLVSVGDERGVSARLKRMI
jgi:hypothetical protein